jgi:membrane protein DedA with SNARE-associated domain
VPSLFLGLTEWITSFVAGVGYLGIFLLMTIEGIITPIPSELIIPFAGYLAAQGLFQLPLVILVATAGSTLGSTVAYYIGYYGGRPLILRYGRFVGLGEDDIRWAEVWFEKYGDWGNFIGHAIPGVRSFISFPAGMGKMDLKRYVVSTALGSAVWNTVLAVAGFLLLDRWIAVAETTSNIDLYIVVGAIAGIVGYVYWRKFRAKRRAATRSGES